MFIYLCIYLSIYPAIIQMPTLLMYRVRAGSIRLNCH